MEKTKMVECSYEELDIDKVQLDRHNPRIRKYLEMYGDKITGETIAFALNSSGDASSTTYDTLKESIRVSGRIIHPILVNKYPDGTLTVIEGNTRLQIYKEFNDADPKSGLWKRIPSIVYNNLDSLDIEGIRLQSHLVGPRDWDPYSKAKYLNQLYNIDKLPMSQIISFCGGKTSEIKKLIDAYNDMEKYYSSVQKDGFEPDIRDFSKFSELQNVSIITSLNLAGFNKQDFANWVINGNIDNAMNVRKLPAVLKNPVARAEFLKTNISKACESLTIDMGLDQKFKNISYDSLAKELSGKIRNMPFQEFKSLRDDPNYAEKKALLLDLLDDLTELKQEIEGDD
jgi:hypothetical protein